MSVVCQGRFWTNLIGRFIGERECFYDCSSIPENLNFQKQRDKVEKNTMKNGTKNKHYVRTTSHPVTQVRDLLP